MENNTTQSDNKDTDQNIDQEHPLIRKIRPKERWNLTYEEAKAIVREEGISSKGEYFKWWALNHPARLPKRPDRAYKNYNFKWANFLGVKNPFPAPRKKFVSYEECKEFCRKNGIKTEPQWREFRKSGKRPDNIPAHPEIVYRGKPRHLAKWISFNNFFDTKPLERMERVSKMEEYLIIYKLNVNLGNVYYFSQKLCSPQTLLFECKKILEDYEIYAVYLIGNYNYRIFLSKTYREYAGLSNCFIIENINDLYFNFDINMTNKIHDVINSL